MIFGRAVGGHQDVRRLQVAMDDAQPVRLGHAAASVSTSGPPARAGQGVPSSRRSRLPPSTYSSSK